MPEDRPAKCIPVIEAQGLYLLKDIRKAFGLSDRQLAAWKREELLTIRLPGGDAVVGADLISWLRTHRRKQPRGPFKKGTP